MEGDFVEQVRESAKFLSSKEEMLGKGLNIPNNATNSGVRKIMDGTHQSHSLVLSRGEIPYLSTGFENRFGDESSSVIEVKDDYVILAKVSKFDYAPNHHYYLILQNIHNKEIDVIERISYKYITEAYGYLYNNSYMDSYFPGNQILRGTVLRRSTGFDQFGNKTNGSNVNVTYMALDGNMEDSVIISDYCSTNLSAPLIRNVKVMINENDIPLNIYGNDEVYKIFPDIGEDVKNGILMAYRREKKEEAIYTQSIDRLQQIMMSDDKITIKGKVIDINIYCNNKEALQDGLYNQQFASYYANRIRMCSEIVQVVGPYIASGCEMSYDMQKLFARCKDEVNGKLYIDKRKLFSNIIIEFTVMEDRILGIGDKVADRYGGKGVVSKIVPRERMPRLPNGQYVDMIKNSSTMYGRENAGQVFEYEINYISMNILDKIRNSNMSLEESIDLVLKFVKIQSPTQYRDMKDYVSVLDRDGLVSFMESILNRTCINVSNLPMSETMTIDKLAELYDAFPWINQVKCTVPIRDSNGNVRYVETRRPMIIAPQYCLRLKQFAEEKFSAVSLSSTNIKNENSKSKASKNYREPYSSTAIKFGYMESGDLNHAGAESIVLNFMLHSISPHGRRLVEQVAVGDPYNVDVKLDTKAKNRSAEILNARLKTMGYRIRFKKKLKKKKYAALIEAIFFEDYDPNTLRDALVFNQSTEDIKHYHKTLKKIEDIKKKKRLKPALIFSEKMDDVYETINADKIEKLKKEEKGV